MKIRSLSFWLIVLAVLAGSRVAPAGDTNVTGAAARTNEVVARVNGRELTRQDLNIAKQAVAAQIASQGGSVPAAKMAEFEHSVLEDLIGRELVMQDGQKNLIEGLDAKVANEVDKVKTRAGGDEEFGKALAESGLTAADYARRVRDNLIIRETIEQTIKRGVTLGTNDVRAYFDAHREKFVQPEQVRASHILILVPAGSDDKVKADKRSQIEAARALVKGGQAFAEVAEKFSEDPGSKPKGGDLGFFPRGAMVPEFDTAAFSLGTSEISEIVTTQYGYHVLKVTDKKPRRDASFEEVREVIERILKNEKSAEVIRTYVTGLRAAAKVEILLPALPAATDMSPATVVTTPPMSAPNP